MPAKKTDEKEPASMSKRFVEGCLFVFVGIVLLKLTIDLLAHFWFWLVLIGFLAAAAVIVWRVVRARRERW